MKSVKGTRVEGTRVERLTRPVLPPTTTTSAVDDELHQERLVPVQCSRRLVASPRACALGQPY